MIAADFSLEGKVAVVTGGARGLGLEMMRALAEAGAAVASVDLLRAQGEEATRDIARDCGVRAAAYTADVTDAAQVSATFGAIERELGAIDILVAAAGIVENVAAEDVDAAAWRRIIDVNITGVFLCAQAAGRAMLTHGGGSIILIASMSGLIANRPQKQTAYNVSKAGVIMMAKSLAAEWADRGVRVNAIAPGYMRTALTDQVLAGQEGLRETWESHIPLGRMGTPPELRGAVVYLASPASSYVTGHALVIDGGYTAWWHERTDEIAFHARVTFFHLLAPQTRQQILAARKEALISRLARLTEMLGAIDQRPEWQYGAALLGFMRERIERELAWIDELAERGRREAAEDR